MEFEGSSWYSQKQANEQRTVASESTSSSPVIYAYIASAEFFGLQFCLHLSPTRIFKERK
jgi:hypothetical protein